MIEDLACIKDFDPKIVLKDISFFRFIKGWCWVSGIQWYQKNHYYKNCPGIHGTVLKNHPSFWPANW